MKIFDHLSYDSFTSMYQSILRSLINDSAYRIAPRGLPIREDINVTVLVNPNDYIINFGKTQAPERQEVYDKYRKAELEWYLSGNTLASSAPSKFWNSLASEDGHITSNYGHMMLFDPLYPAERPTKYKGTNSEGKPVFGHLQEVEGAQTAFERVVEILVKDPDSRQAIVHYNQPRHCYPQNKDFPCTMYSQFFIRNGCLSMTTYQRSCDVIKGFSYDVPWNCHFMNMVLKELQARGLEVSGGEYTHVFGSLHLYEKDLELANKIIN